MKYGLIGKTLAHSYSKEIHEALGRYSYELFSLTPQAMSEFISARAFGGLNITIPYKQDVIPLCDEVSELASAIGAVNTLYWKKDSSCGRPVLAGHNTDYEGFLYAAERANIDFNGKTVLILGSGGTSLTARKAAADSGAAMIYIASRSAGSDASKAAEDGGTPCDTSGGTCPVSRLSYEELHTISGDVEIIVNTTPVGTFPGNLESIIQPTDFPRCEAVMDVIYNPFRTKLLMDAEKAGFKTSNGLPMLVAQATAAAGFFLGTPSAFQEENERIIQKLTGELQNIVLIGMPGCGKSTVGRIIAKKTGKQLVDMDAEIIKKAGKPIPQIFEESGESGFRDLESQVAAELGKQRGLVIATGGGAVLRSENVDALRQNGLVIHIKRPVELLSTKGRPLSKDLKTLREMERARLPLYEAAADVTFNNVSTTNLKAQFNEDPHMKALFR